MALCTMVILVGVPTASVIYSGAKVITGNFQGFAPFGLDLGNITVGCWIIGTLSAIHVFAGGLKACAWADLIQGTALVLLAGVVIAAFAMSLLADRSPQELIQTARNQEVTAESLQNAGPIQRFWDLNKGPLPDGKTHMVRGSDDKEIPWTADYRFVDSQFLLLGSEPIHHAADAGLEVLGRRPTRNRVRGLSQADHPLR